MTSDARLLAHADRFQWDWIDPQEPWVIQSVTIERRTQQRAKAQWAVCYKGYVLNKKGQWEWDRLPSSRSAKHLEACRWSSMKKALAFVEKTLPGWASSGPLPGLRQQKALLAKLKAARDASFATLAAKSVELE